MIVFLQDLNRQVVKSDAASFTIPELEFESPAFSQKGGKGLLLPFFSLWGEGGGGGGGGVGISKLFSEEINYKQYYY